MARRTMRRAAFVLTLLLLIELVVFIVSLPGFGIETRSLSAYAPWSGPIFLLLTILIFLSGLAGIGLASRRPRASAKFGWAMGLAAILTVVLDDSRVAGPAPPPGPYALGFVAILVALAIFAAALRVGRDATPPTR